MKNFDEMVPETFAWGFPSAMEKVAAIPALSYGTPMEEIKQMVNRDFYCENQNRCTWYAG
ncbi:MAG: hypothetical protein R3C61_26815 [Bacteroidia bacterium]